MKICGVSFKENGKSYNFNADGFALNSGDLVIVETEKGLQIGTVTHVIENNNYNNNYKQVVRIASEVDYDKYLRNLSDAKQALIETRKIVEKLGLNMKIIDSNYTFERNQLLFNFISDERVDFRELVRELASKYKTRIELHQMGVRDKSKEIGGIGPCGRTLCCASFLNQIETISINMAKNQNIALNPNKINGTCGRLLCCLSYEEDQYINSRSDLPNIGDIIKYQDKNVRVISVDVMNRKYKINNDDEIIEIKM